MERDLIIVKDEGVPLSFTWNSMYAFCGPRQIIASALMFRLFERAFRELSPGAAPERGEIAFLSGFPGQGIAECVELVTRIASRCPERYRVDPTAAPAEAPDSIGGKFYFEVEIGARRRAYWPSARLFDDDFRARVIRFQDGDCTAEERAAYADYKRTLAQTIYALPDEALFTCA